MMMQENNLFVGVQTLKIKGAGLESSENIGIGFTWGVYVHFPHSL